MLCCAVLSCPHHVILCFFLLRQAIRECIADGCDPQTVTKVFRDVLGLMGRRRNDEQHEHLYFKFQNSKQVFLHRPFYWWCTCFGARTQPTRRYNLYHLSG